jgi:hypothetical protein
MAHVVGGAQLLCCARPVRTADHAVTLHITKSNATDRGIWVYFFNFIFAHLKKWDTFLTKMHIHSVGPFCRHYDSFRAVRNVEMILYAFSMCFLCVLLQSPWAVQSIWIVFSFYLDFLFPLRVLPHINSCTIFQREFFLFIKNLKNTEYIFFLYNCSLLLLSSSSDVLLTLCESPNGNRLISARICSFVIFADTTKLWNSLLIPRRSVALGCSNVLNLDVMLVLRNTGVVVNWKDYAVRIL